MKLKQRRRPFSLVILAVITISLSLWIIAYRLQVLLSIHSPDPNAAITGEAIVNIELISGISFLGMGFVPLILGVGLWRLARWARALSICFFASVMLPSLLAAIGVISDNTSSRLNNIAVVFGGIASLWILFRPSVAIAFNARSRSSKSTES